MTDRPLTARSVVASLLLGTTPPRLPARTLVRASELLGVAEGTTRVALSRMVSAGELTAVGGGYQLAGPLLERRDRQEEGRRPRTRPWDGTWVMAVVGGVRRPAAQRAAARRRLAAMRLAEWREGVWLRPDNLAGPHGRLDGCSWVTGARPEEEGLASALWDLEGWAARAASLREALASTPPPERLAAAFELAAATVRHLRDDPLLPPGLLPAGWPGDGLRADYDRYEAGFQAALRELLAG